MSLKLAFLLASIVFMSVAFVFWTDHDFSAVLFLVSSGLAVVSFLMDGK